MLFKEAKEHDFEFKSAVVNEYWKVMCNKSLINYSVLDAIFAEKRQENIMTAQIESKFEMIKRYVPLIPYINPDAL